MTRVSRLLLVALATIALMGVGLVDAQAQEPDRTDEFEPPKAVAENDLPDEPPLTITSPTGGAELADLEVVADQLGISIGSAVERFEWHDNFSAVVDEIRRTAPDDFAYSEIGEGSASIWFAGALPEGSARAIETFREQYPRVRLDLREHYGLTERDAEEMVIAAHRSILGRDDISDLMTRFDYHNRHIIIEANTSAGLEALAHSATNSAAKDLDVSVVVVRSESVDVDHSSSYHHGGEALSSCTSSFGIRYVSAPTWLRGTTAGHCTPSISDDGVSLSRTGTYDGYFGDFAMHWGSQAETDDFYAGQYQGTITEYNLRDLSSWVAAPSVNQWLCKNGKTSKKTCDQVESTFICAGVNCYQVLMKNGKATFGDSGGPWYWSLTAYGVHEGAYGGKDNFSRADQLAQVFPGWTWAT